MRPIESKPVTDSTPRPPYTSQLIKHMINNVVCFVVVTFLYIRTVAAWVRRYGFHLTGQQRRLRRRGIEARGASFGGVQHRQAKALWRLMAILLVFDATWLVVIINDIAAVREGQNRGQANAGMGDAPSTFMVRDWRKRTNQIESILTPRVSTNHRRSRTPSSWEMYSLFGAAGPGSAHPQPSQAHAASRSGAGRRGRPSDGGGMRAWPPSPNAPPRVRLLVNGQLVSVVHPLTTTGPFNHHTMIAQVPSARAPATTSHSASSSPPTMPARRARPRQRWARSRLGSPWASTCT